MIQYGYIKLYNILHICDTSCACCLAISAAAAAWLSCLELLDPPTLAENRSGTCAFVVIFGLRMKPTATSFWQQRHVLHLFIVPVPSTPWSGPTSSQSPEEQEPVKPNSVHSNHNEGNPLKHHATAVEKKKCDGRPLQSASPAWRPCDEPLRSPMPRIVRWLKVKSWGTAVDYCDGETHEFQFLVNLMVETCWDHLWLFRNDINFEKWWQLTDPCAASAPCALATSKLPGCIRRFARQALGLQKSPHLLRCVQPVLHNNLELFEWPREDIRKITNHHWSYWSLLISHRKNHMISQVP